MVLDFFYPSNSLSVVRALVLIISQDCLRQSECQSHPCKVSLPFAPTFAC